MKRRVVFFVFLFVSLRVLTAQDSVLVLSRQINTQIIQQDTILILSTFGQFPAGIYSESELVISSEPFPFFLMAENTTGIKHVTPIEGLKIYPNPVTDVAILERQNTDELFRILLYHSDGTFLSESLWGPDQQKQISLHRNAPGMYFILVMNEDRTQASTYRIVKR